MRDGCLRIMINDVPKMRLFALFSVNQKPSPDKLPHMFGNIHSNATERRAGVTIWPVRAIIAGERSAAAVIFQIQGAL